MVTSFYRQVDAWRNNLSLAAHEVFSWTFVRLYLIIGIIFNLLTWLGAVLIYRSIEQELTVLHYNVDFGIDLIGNRAQIFSNPTLGLVLWLLNFIVLLLVARNRHFKFLAYLILNTTLIVNALLLLAVVAVYLINFS